MPLTAAEKQKRYRERMRYNNPEKFAEVRLKNAARNKNRRKVNECTENEKETLRKQWRNRKNTQKKNLKESFGRQLADTEGPDTHSDSIEKARLAERKKFSRHLAIVKSNYETKISNLTEKYTALKKQCYRLIEKQKQLHTYVEELKGKISEVEIKEEPTTQNDNGMTPLIKTENFIEENIPNIKIEEC